MGISGFISIIVLLIIQVVAFAYGYGKIVQKVSNIDLNMNDLSNRFKSSERRIQNLESRAGFIRSLQNRGEHE